MIGQTIGHYRILEELGRGGIGVVYTAHDTKLDRPAVLKVLKSELLEDMEPRQRFSREARSYWNLKTTGKSTTTTQAQIA
jgi:serine/threonine protein kinase